MLVRFLANQPSFDGDQFLYVLIEGEGAFPASSDNHLEIDPNPTGWDNVSPSDIAEWERQTLLFVKDGFEGTTYPQVITRNLRQAQIIFNVKCRRISRNTGFESLVFTL